ncbi:DUF5013 domain-containing protein [Fulvivirga sediminis]|uniref:DUF5013 domain-containing protein n=1 Tax=Fulvivirga sediminis TaxID=2803949 RepID=A0A937JZL8_9BACT|nr:DUF5013 domain-containing protein [Fulvivirga sediminis]MBL3655346.1 DUF5013 domain-containing protein [Fulvivirga sediminis]
MKNLINGICIMMLLFLAVSCADDEVSLPEVESTVVDVGIRFGGTQLNIPEQRNFSVNPDQTLFTVPLGITLSTVSMEAFEVEVSVNNERVNQLIANGELGDAVLLPASKYTIPAQVNVQANTISAPLPLVLDFDVLTEYQDENLALAVQIDRISKHTLVSEKSTVVIFIDADQAYTQSQLGEVTEQFLTNTGYPFISTDRVYAGARWGNLDGWQANEAAMSHDGYGGFNSDAGGTFGLESGWGSPTIPNGKVYQVTTLPEGNYVLQVAEWEWDGIKDDPAYFVVNIGDNLPDVDNLEAEALNYVPLSKGAIEFTLHEETEVSLGVVVNFVQDVGQGFKIKKLTLTRSL